MIESFRYILPGPNGRDVNPTGMCEAFGCIGKTKEGKSYCTKHITRMPYVRKIADRMAHREWEINEIRITGKVPRNSILIGIIKDHLYYMGSKSNRKLARDLDISVPVMDKS